MSDLSATNGTPTAVRFGMVGAGAIAQAYAQAFRASPPQLIRLAAVADTRPAAAEGVAESMGCAAFPCVQSMLQEMSLDATLVCTPPATHPQICQQLAEAGVHILCEKPLATETTLAMEMLAKAEQHGVTLTMASKFRYVEDVAIARSIMTSGVLGEVILFENSFTSHVDMSQRWNSDPSVSGGGVLIDNGTHSVDIMRYFLGPLADLQVVEGRRTQGMDVEDTVRMFVRSATGVLGSIDLSWSLNKELPYYIAVYGSQGTLLVGWQTSRYRRSLDDRWISFGSGYDKIRALQGQLENFAHALRGEEPLVISHEDALASVAVVEAGYRSLRQHAWEAITHF